MAIGREGYRAVLSLNNGERMRLGAITHDIILVPARSLGSVLANLNSVLAIYGLHRNINSVTINHIAWGGGSCWHMSAAVVDDFVVGPFNINLLRRNLKVKGNKSTVVADSFDINIASSNIGIVIVGNLVIASLNVIGV